MGVGQHDPRFICFFRSALFVGLGSVVATIIYLTPIPGTSSNLHNHRRNEERRINRIKYTFSVISARTFLDLTTGTSTIWVIYGIRLRIKNYDRIVITVSLCRSSIYGKFHWKFQNIEQDGTYAIRKCPGDVTQLKFLNFQNNLRRIETLHRETILTILCYFLCWIRFSQ